MTHTKHVAFYEQHLTLENGSRLHLLPRPEFHQMVAMVTVDYGARDKKFKKAGQILDQPAGVAHFLEHKLFEENGYDAFTRLSELGANANAFTTQSRTSYYLTSEPNNIAAFRELLMFTQRLNVTEESVQKEASIIAQEIDMYQDDINTRLYRLILGRLYPTDSLAEDIAGTSESIQQIQLEDLQMAFDSFYRAERIDIVVAGAFDDTEVKAQVAEAISRQEATPNDTTVSKENFQPVVEETLEFELDTVRTKVAVGQRWFENVAMTTGRDALKQAIAISLAVDLIFGEFSPTYMTWYDAGLIDDGFSAEFDWERGFAFLTIAADTPEPEELIQKITYELQHFTNRFESLASDFGLVKNDAMSRLISKLNQLEELVVRFEGATFDYASLQDEIHILKALTVTDVQQVLAEIPVSPVAAVIARPQTGELC